MLTRDALKMASHRMFFSSAKADARSSAITARPYREGLSDALDWFRQRRFLRVTIAAGLAALSFFIWLYMVWGRGFFWLARERDDRDEPALTPRTGPPSAPWSPRGTRPT